jgi:hypothetical protein
LLVAQLDDSGSDPQNPITCLAGYAASEETWAQFESEAEPIFQEYIGGLPLHAMDMHQGKPPYDGWKVLKKQAFVAKLCLVLYPHKPFGVSFSVLKASYAIRATEALKRGLRKRTVTPHTFCAEAILNWLLLDPVYGKMANEVGLAIIMESGNAHNQEAKQAIDRIIEIHGLHTVKSVSFVHKQACRAIQMADLLAFYTRRHTLKTDQETRQEPEVDPVLKVLLENLRKRSFVATDFGPDIKVSRFFGGAPNEVSL